MRGEQSVVAALIVATGKTGRGLSLDPLKKVGTIPAVQRMVMVLRRAGIQRVVVVCEGEGGSSEKLAPHMGAVYLQGRQNAQMLDNVKVGLAYLLGNCTAAVIAHVGAPLFSVGTVRALIAAKGPVRIPCYAGRKGHPILLEAGRFESVLTYFGDGGLAGVIRESGLHRELVPVEDEGVTVNMAGGENHRLPTQLGLSEIYSDLKIRLAMERPFYGPGAHQLLQLTREEGSLREACRLMGISYSKGRGIIAVIEQQLGSPVIESRQGGKAGGHSTLTPKGEELARSYDEFCAEARRRLRGLVPKYFGGLE